MFMSLYFFARHETENNCDTVKTPCNLHETTKSAWHLPTPHGQMAPGHQLLVTLSPQPANSRTLWLQNKRACKSIVCTTLPVHCQKASPTHQPPSRKPNTTRNSWSHPTPTSPAMTTRRALPFPQHNSGYVLTLSFLASPGAAPSVMSAPRLRVPSPWSGKTSVASSASWHPPNKVSPSATTSKRRPSEFCGGQMSKSLSITLVDTRAPPSRQI